MSLQGATGDPRAVIQTGLHRHHLGARNDRGVHLAKGHPQQVQNPDLGAGRDGLNPEAEVASEDGQHHQSEDDDGENDDNPEDRGSVALVSQEGSPGIVPDHVRHLKGRGENRRTAEHRRPPRLPTLLPGTGTVSSEQPLGGAGRVALLAARPAAYEPDSSNGSTPTLSIGWDRISSDFSAAVAWRLLRTTNRLLRTFTTSTGSPSSIDPASLTAS